MGNDKDGCRPAPGGAAEVRVTLNADAMRPLVREIVGEVLARLDAQGPRPDRRLAFSEEEAARLLGLEHHQLRDERRRGRIAASVVVGRRVRYTREDLVGYLLQRRVPAQDRGAE
jgi:hypothetical protein